MAVDNIARGMAASALENQGGGGSSLPIVNTAAIGQTIRVSAVDEDGKPTEWEAGNVSWNDLEDKPFYDKEPENIVIVPETNITGQSSDPNFMAVLDYIDFVVGQVYQVTFDGTVYSCDALYENGIGVLLGSKSLALGGEADDIPFAVVTFPEYPEDGTVVVLKDGTEHTISITTLMVVSVPMAERFLPKEAVANIAEKVIDAKVSPILQVAVNTTYYGGDDPDTYTLEPAGVTFDEVLEASRSGLLIMKGGGRDMCVTQALRDGKWVLDCYRFCWETNLNKGVPGLEVLTLHDNGTCIERVYGLTTI